MRHYFALSLLVLMMICLLSCDSSSSSGKTDLELLADTPIVRVYRTAQFTHDDSSDTVLSYGSKIIIVENQPVRLKQYHIDNGVQKLSGEMVVDPAITPFITANESVKGEKARIELTAPQISTNHGRVESYLYVESAFPVPARFACNIGGAGSYIPEGEELILKFWIEENDDTAIKGIVDSIETMIAVSKQIDASFVVITAEPLKPQ